jgi:hypothetical protein
VKSRGFQAFEGFREFCSVLLSLVLFLCSLVRTLEVFALYDENLRENGGFMCFLHGKIGFL